MPLITSNGMQIHYRRSGAGNQAMVLVHGVTDSSRSWMNFIRPLESAYDLVAYDVRGHGLSAKPETGYGLADHLGDLAGLLSALRLERPILVGHSMGGGIVAAFAAEHPDVPRAVILEDPAYFEWPQPLDEAVAGFAARMELYSGLSKSELVKLSRTESPLWAEADREPWAEGKSEFTTRVLETMRQLPQIAPLLPRITAPTLILKADAPPDQSRRHARAASAIHGRLVHIDGAAHNIHRDQPAAMLAAIRDFLAAHGC